MTDTLIGQQSLGDLLTALAARQPTPGGGAAAAISAAIACATGAMACRYTTGDKWPAITVEATALAQQLDAWRDQAVTLADADAAAYAAVGAAKKTADPVRIATAQQAAAAVPVTLIALCVSAATACAGFRPRCNQWLVSDIDTAVHLLAGAGRAARRTMMVNQPDDGQVADADQAMVHLTRLELT